MDVVELAGGRSGHFLLESGHHGDLWLELDRLFQTPVTLEPLVTHLAARLSDHAAEVVCGPVSGGAFVALLVARELGVGFCHAERIEGTPVRYRVPAGMRPAVRGRRVAVVDDVMNAGSAVRKTLADLRECGARPVAVSALLTLGPSAAGLAAEWEVPLVELANRGSEIWQPDACPLCAEGRPVSDPHAVSWETTDTGH